MKQSQNENDVILTFMEKIRQILCRFPLITTSWACSEIEKGIIILFFFKFRQHYFCNIWHAILRSVPMCPIWDMYCSCNTLWMLVYIVKKKCDLNIAFPVVGEFASIVTMIIITILAWVRKQLWHIISRGNKIGLPRTTIPWRMRIVQEWRTCQCFSLSLSTWYK